ncbi:hypothetical protein AB4510_02035 [Vibrio sp. 10N.222.54.B12]|uniref:hypothetical protein n=1 Tax=unclassified Vibrio TaxID=2614977 RepID=UPI003550A9B5
MIWLKKEETNYFMSISDIMSGLMFIFIIVLAVFVVDFLNASIKHEKIIAELEVDRELQRKINETLILEEQKIREENQRLQEERASIKIENSKLQNERNIARGILGELSENQRLRSKLLENIQAALVEAEIAVIVDEEHGIVRLDENAIQFSTGEASLNDLYMKRLMQVGRVMEEILPCYSIAPPKNKHCLPETAGKLDSIFIEGHTDNVPIRGALQNRYFDNWDLSTARANYTFKNLVVDNRYLAEMKNSNDQPIFSVSGYGEGRPLAGHDHQTPTSDARNRRIDFRLIMTPPTVTEAQRALEGNI